MRIGGRGRAWLALLGVVVALAAPAEAAPKRGEVVLRGTAGGTTVTLPAGFRFVVNDGFLPTLSGNVRGVVIREAASADLVLAAVRLAVPGSDPVGMFQRGQGYETGRLSGGRYRITLLGDDKRAKDIVLPVEGVSGRKVLKLAGGAYQRAVGLADPIGAKSTYRAGTLEIAYPMGLIYAWTVKRGAGLHRVNFCFVPEGTDCPPAPGFVVNQGTTRHAGAHMSVPSTRPYGKYELVLDLASAGPVGAVGMVGYIFI